MQKNEKSTIDLVLFNHVGTDEDFNFFLRSVLKDYLTGEGKNNQEHIPGYSPRGVVLCVADEESETPKGE